MGKIGDLFVRLGLKSDDYKKGIDKAKKDTQGFGASLGKMKAGALAVWAAIGTAVIKFSEDFIGATNKIGDAWAREMAAMKAGYHTFLASLTNAKVDTSSVGGFFKSLWKGAKETFGNVKEAREAAKEMADAFDAEFELTHSIRLQKQAIQQELNELYAKMRDTSASNADRKAAQERYKALLQPIADAEVEVYGNMMDAAIKPWQAGTTLNRTRDEIVEFFTNIGTDAEAMKAKFPDIYDVFNNFKGDATNLPIFDIIGQYQEAANQMSNIEREMSRVTNSINADIKRSLDAIAAEVATYGQEDLKLDLEIDIDVDEADMELADAMLQELIANIQNKQAEIAALNQMIEDSFIQAFSGSVQAIIDAAMGVEGAGFEQVMAAVMQPIANTAIQLGEMLIAEGLAISAFKESLKSLNPAVALSAGATLIAVGAALAAGVKKLGVNPAGGTTATATTSSAGSSVSSGIETYQQEITVRVVGTLSGSDIVLSGEKTLNKWSR